MSKFKTYATAWLLLPINIFLVSAASAVMPPAPYEWYERLNIAIPDAAKRSAPVIPEAIERDLALAAQLRPDNTDNLLIILVQFVDNPADTFSHPAQAYSDLFFSTGVIPTGSVVEYFREISYGTFTPEGTVVAWITAPQQYIYYTYGLYGEGPYPNNSQGLLEDCVNQLDPVIDFSQFDNDGDGYAEGIIMVHAGPGGEETADPETIWSHAWSWEVETDDGVRTGRYSINPESSIDGSLITIGVFCHEYGHMLGMPDLYDYDGSSEGVGIYCLMGSGSWGSRSGYPERPAHMCAELKRRLGWLTPIEVTGSLADVYIPAVETAAVCYKITHPSNPDEFFLLENRAKIGFDSLFFGDGGLAVWHVDLAGNSDNELHPYVGLEQADGNWDLMRHYGKTSLRSRNNPGDAGDFYPGATGNHYFSFSSNPSSYSYDYDSAKAYLTVDDIQVPTADWIRADIYADPSVPIYRVFNVAVFDTVTGGPTPNYNNEADAGETVDIVVSIYCDGVSASDIVGTISCSDPRVNIVSAGGQFTPAAHNSTTENTSDPFRIQILSAGADSAATLNLYFNADGLAYDTQFKMNINRQRILVVLDNNNSHWSDNLVSAMHRTGFSFDTLRQSSLFPISYDNLISYPAVLWTTASYFGRRISGNHFAFCLTSNEMAVLKEYLDNAGRLGLFSQDYLYDVGSNWFTTDYLYAGISPGDIPCTHVVGNSGTFMEGFEGYTGEWSYYDYTDTVYSIGGGATDLEMFPGGSHPLMIQYPMTPQVGNFVTTFSGFGIERLEDAALVNFLSRWCGWILTNTNIDVPIPTLPANSDTITDQQPIFAWTPSEGAVSYTIQVALDFTFAIIIRDSTVNASSMHFPVDLPFGTYFWRVKAIPAGDPATPFSPRSTFTVEEEIFCGDANGDEGVNVGDAVFLVSYVFKGGAAPTPLCAGDANGDGSTNVGDAVYMISYVFKGGAAPVTTCCP